MELMDFAASNQPLRTWSKIQEVNMEYCNGNFFKSGVGDGLYFSVAINCDACYHFRSSSITKCYMYK